MEGQRIILLTVDPDVAVVNDGQEMLFNLLKVRRCRGKCCSLEDLREYIPFALPVVVDPAVLDYYVVTRRDSIGAKLLPSPHSCTAPLHSFRTDVCDDLRGDICGVVEIAVGTFPSNVDVILVSCPISLLLIDGNRGVVSEFRRRSEHDGDEETDEGVMVLRVKVAD